MWAPFCVMKSPPTFFNGERGSIFIRTLAKQLHLFKHTHLQVQPNKTSRYNILLSSSFFHSLMAISVESPASTHLNKVSSSCSSFCYSFLFFFSPFYSATPICRSPALSGYRFSNFLQFDYRSQPARWVLLLCSLPPPIGAFGALYAAGSIRFWRKGDLGKQR